MGRGLFYFGGDILKIKKILKRIAAPLLCVVLLLGLLTFSVSAASSGWHDVSTNLKTLVGENTAAIFYNDTLWREVDPYEWYGNAGVSYHLPYEFPVGAWTLRIPMGYIDLDLQAGDTFQFSALYEGTFYEDIGSNPTVRLAFIHREVMEGGATNEIVYSYDFTPKYNGTIGRYTHDVNINWTTTRDVNINYIYAFVDISNRPETGSGSGGRTRFYLKQLKMGFGNIQSPEAPSYSSPSGGEKVDELENAEQELESNTSEGQEQVEEIISPETLTSTLLSYAKGLQFTSRIMLSAITKIPFLNALIWVSMSLGFVATLFALSASIIAASDRRAGSSARAGKDRRR